MKGFRGVPQRAPPEVERLLVAEVARQKPQEARQLPMWLKHVIDNRDRFADCCVYNDDGSVMPMCVYKIILCKQNPRTVCFLKLTRHVRRLPDISAMAPGIQPQLCPFVFDFMPLTFYNEQSAHH